MTRIALGIEYDGSDFRGWQRQKDARSVQECLEAAVSRVADQPVELVCAGRTDAGVHATAQIVHFDTAAHRSEQSWVLGCNANLPKTISVRWAKGVDESFHARFSARARAYRYVIYMGRARPALLRHQVSWTHKALDAERMQEAARPLLGEHDFSSFRAVACQAKHPVRTLQRLDVWRAGDFIYLDVQANAFLHHMVRNLAGTLMAIGCGDQPVGWAGDVLAARDRCAAGITAPAQGLYLVRVDYPPRYAMPGAGRLPVFS
ncbi:tRNA pseudouridine(38-40) synthase TruA [Alkalilimnicola sp. S0819]|uniref:tRNA pseudouridine(38-40) synthase TruA n=1 Tax=Alkalilimnicola sp. S0819 TaxID=2613922 RepID=UPI0012628FEC|nr:tRNA pseudouridine(38-40) synthase TruA [Alkalilimnicola sp. S0819]KAB7627859.1 tRNA pseudouridine(38-40) synthase TruA [Alkalilimnicola sp. S0819]MPQ15493.1 tRNA pseudouridine(38-40) synthase TruA [Alkalilimnicola sp. S0819]